MGFHASPCRPCGSHRLLKRQYFIMLLFNFHPVSFELEHHTSTTPCYHVFIVCASNSIIHVQRSQLGTFCHSPTAAAGLRLPLQRPEPTDRWLKFQSFFLTFLFPFPLHGVRLRRKTETPPAPHFVIVCASNSEIHVQRSQLGTWMIELLVQFDPG